jgi:hypothetical protein
MKRLTTLLTFVFFIQIGLINITRAQVDDLGSFMATGKEDAQKLMQAYLSPYLNAFGACLTGGWYNTAKTHKPGGFDLTITGNMAIVPSKYRTFNVDELELQSLTIIPGTESESPTVAGKDNKGPQMNYKNIAGLENRQAFQLPSGTNFPYVPIPMIQLGVGLFKDTEITGRYVPKIGVGKNNDIGMWGVGLKHGLKQWIPFIKKIPVLNLTLQGGYTRLNTNLGIKVTPENIGLEEFNTLPIPSETWNDQKLILQTNSYTGNLIVSADLRIVCFYGGVGFATTKTNLKMKGYYPTLVITGGSPALARSDKDPISFEVKNQDGGTTKPRFNAGMRLKFGVFTLHFDYTRANYNVATAGIGLSFR